MTGTPTSPNEPGDAMAPPSPEVRNARVPSLALAWAVTIAEGVLFGGLLWLFVDYWLMLPVRYRWKGGIGLAVLAIFILTRLILFYRRYRRAKRKNETP